MRLVGGKFSVSLVVSLLIAAAIGWFLFEQLNGPDRGPPN